MSKDIRETIKEKHLGDKPELYIQTQNEEQHRVLSKEDEEYLDSKYEGIIEFMRENYKDFETEGEKDEMYATLQTMWREVAGKQGKINEISFDLILTRDEHSLLLDLLKNKLEYDVDTVFYAIELRSMVEGLTSDTKFEDDFDVKHLEMTPIDMTYLYHIISKYKVKGLNKKAYTFANILTSIGRSSKLINYYNNLFKDLSELIQKWVGSMEGYDLPESDRELLGVEPKGKPVLGGNPQQEASDEVTQEVETIEEEIPDEELVSDNEEK